PTQLKRDASSATSIMTGPRKSAFQQSARFWVSKSPPPLVDQIRDQGGPARLMTCAEARSGVSMEMFVEQDQIAPERIALHSPRGVKDGTSSRRVALENPDQPFRDFVRQIGMPESHERLDDEIRSRKPDRSAPI